MKNKIILNEENEISLDFNGNKSNSYDSINSDKCRSKEMNCTFALRRDEESQTCNNEINDFYENIEFETNLMLIKTFDGLTIDEVGNTVHNLHVLSD